MKHILYMPDGNSRFARKRKISLKVAYTLGGRTLELFARYFLLDKDCTELTYHALSKYTHKRTNDSLNIIYEVTTETIIDLLKKEFFHDNNLRFIGIDHSKQIPEDLVNIITKLEKETKQNKKIVRVLLGYDLQTDSRCAYECSNNFDEFKARLTIPPIDLVVRPMEMRPSKGPVYAMAQAQMIILPKLNPEVTRKDLEKLWKKYNKLIDYRKTTNPEHKVLDS